jgi:hypothetical protein
MKYGGYYLVFFVFIGFLLIILYYNNIQPQQQQSINNINSDLSIKYNKYNVDDDHIKLYKDQSNYKKTNNLNNINNYTYNIDNIDILKDNNNFNNDSKLGNNNTSSYEPELEEVYNSTLRGNIYDINEPDEIFNYSIKPNKSDLPIINPPLQLLQSNAPLRLSERHVSYD